MTPANDLQSTLELSIVVPAHNEQDNILKLVDEIRNTILNTGIHAELIIVNDGSTDATLSIIADQQKKYPWLRALHRHRMMGQSAAIHAGIHASQGKYIATLDADLQNDPADLPPMLQILRSGKADVVQGDRSDNRNDSPVRKFSSWVGRTTRRLLLGDTIRDTGCSTRVLSASIARQIPLQFKGIHRFIPLYARLLGATVIEIPVKHRPRVAGVPKYGMLNRGWAGLIDCLAVRWMLNRYRDPSTTPQPPPHR